MSKAKKEDPRERAKRLRRERYAARKADQVAAEAASLEANGEFDAAELARRNEEYLAEHGDAARAKQGLGKKTAANTIRASDNLTAAFDLMGGVPALVRWGRKNPTEFYRIWARLIPKEAVEPTSTMPLEDLLAQLATRSEKTVAEAAYEIGEATLLAAREEVSLEDAAAALSDRERAVIN